VISPSSVSVYSTEVASLGESKTSEHALADEWEGAQPKSWWSRRVGG
jgi:hypothetical protein